MLENKRLSRAIVSLIGLMLCGVGVSLFLYSEMGVDPASVMQLGLANVFGVSYGTASALSNLIILAIVFVVDRSYINVSSIIAIFGIGYTADVMQALLKQLLPGGEPLLTKLLLLVIGILIMAVGIATYIRADLGVGAIDLVSEIITDKLHVPYRIVRVVGDVTFVVVGWLMGGIFGVGTIAAAFLLGPAVQLVRPHVYKLLDKFLLPLKENQPS